MEDNGNPERIRMKRNVNGLKLPSFAIENFRGLKELKLPELGQVTLLVGANSVGKSTVLEAMQLYANAGSSRVMRRIMIERENIVEREEVEDEGGATIPYYVRYREVANMDLDFFSMFFGFGDLKSGNVIKIGPADKSRTLEISLSKLEAAEMGEVHPLLFEDGELNFLKVCMGHKEIGRIPFTSARTFLPRRVLKSFRWNADMAKAFTIECEQLGPGLPSNAEIAPRYEDLLMTDGPAQILELLQSVNGDIEALASRGDGRRESFPRRMIVKYKGVEGQIPLRSMGEGIVRLFGIAVTLIRAKSGILLIDDIDNGIHHSLFQQVWDFVFRAAMINNVQVIATTHSWDCVIGFARASKDQSEKIGGALLRIDREGDHTWAVPYSAEDLLMATKAGIEVR